jgi:hypothetical protein
VADDVDHRVRNILAALRGHLELAHESATSGVAGGDVLEDLTNALDALGRLESRLGVQVDAGSGSTPLPAHGSRTHQPDRP